MITRDADVMIVIVALIVIIIICAYNLGWKRGFEDHKDIMK